MLWLYLHLQHNLSLCHLKSPHKELQVSYAEFTWGQILFFPPSESSIAL